MAAVEANVQDYLKLIPAVKRSPESSVWLTYDEEADVLYFNFTRPSRATDSELTDDDIIIRYDDDKVIGYTVLHASRGPGSSRT